MSSGDMSPGSPFPTSTLHPPPPPVSTSLSPKGGGGGGGGGAGDDVHSLTPTPPRVATPAAPSAAAAAAVPKGKGGGVWTVRPPSPSRSSTIMLMGRKEPQRAPLLLLRASSFLLWDRGCCHSAGIRCLRGGSPSCRGGCAAVVRCAVASPSLRGGGAAGETAADAGLRPSLLLRYRYLWYWRSARKGRERVCV